MDGFDLDAPLVCEGVIGDGCGGGRIFYIEEQRLYAYDPLTKSSLEIATGIFNADSLSKKGCIITILCAERTLKIDLSQI